MGFDSEDIVDNGGVILGVPGIFLGAQVLEVIGSLGESWGVLLDPWGAWGVLLDPCGSLGESWGVLRVLESLEHIRNSLEIPIIILMRRAQYRRGGGG